MAKKSTTLFFLMILALNPCKSGGNVTSNPDPLTKFLENNDKYLALRNMVTNDASKFQQFQSEIRKIYNQGYSLGQKEADEKNILAHFECAVCDQKTLLEVYDDPVTKSLWAGEDKELRDNETNGIKLPADLEYMIEENDQWILLCEAQSSDNGQMNHITHNRYLLITGRNMGTHPFPLYKTSISKLPFTTPFSPEEAKTRLLIGIKKAAANWYRIVTCVDPCPPFVFRLQELLQQIQTDNPHVYESVYEIYWRFAAHTARSYKIMHTVHHQLMKKLKEHLFQNDEKVSFDQLLFMYAPSWNMTHEQISFLNVLKNACDPNHNEPLKYCTVQNNKNELTFVIYDSSKQCFFNHFNKLFTSNVPTLKYY